MTQNDTGRDDVAKLLRRYEADLAHFTEEKREHFLYVIHALMDCYKSEETKAIVLISEGIDDPSRISLIGINADSAETDEMIETLAVFKQIDSSPAGHAMN